MFIPPPGYKNREKGRPEVKTSVRLQSAHLWIQGSVAEKVFGGVHNVYLAYYAERKMLLIAPVTQKEFKAIHKASQHILKMRNAAGDRSIALHELLVDQQLDQKDRDLNYECEPGLNILKVTFG